MQIIPPGENIVQHEEQTYLVHRGSPAISRGQIALDDSAWNDAAWVSADIALVSHFHPRSSDHHPATVARLLYDDANLYLRFDVVDRFVVARATKHQQQVCKDSCAEFFVSPRAGAGYLNFEFNCSGFMLVYHVTDPTRTSTGLAKFAPLKSTELEQIAIAHSMPARVDPERAEAMDWRFCCRIPLGIFEPYIGKITAVPGQNWRANFYKCADKSSHPHWGSWSPIGEQLNFHQPDKFGRLMFF